MQKFLFFLTILILSFVAQATVSNRYDVIVVGAGPVGLATALEAREAGLSVLVIEKRVPEALKSNSSQQNSWGSRLRNVTLDYASVDFLNAKGISGFSSKFDEIQVLHRNEVSHFQNKLSWAEVYKLFFGRLAYGLSNIGQLEKKLLEKAQSKGVEIVFGAQMSDLKNINTNAKDNVEMNLKMGSEVKNLTAKLVIGADGAGSQTAAQLGVKRVVLPDYKEHRMLTADFRVSSKATLAIYNYGNSEAELSMKGLAFAVDGTASVTIPAPATLTDLNDPQQRLFATQLLAEKALALGVDGPILSVASLYSNGIDKTSHSRVGSIFLVGDAARKTNPATGKGINIGFEDIAHLKNVFKKLAADTLSLSDLIKAEKNISDNSIKSNELSLRASSMSNWMGAKQNYYFMLNILKLGLAPKPDSELMLKMKDWISYAKEKLKMPSSVEEGQVPVRMCRQLFLSL